MTVLPNNWVTTDLESIAEILDYKRVPINSKERQKRKENKRLNELYPYYGATGQVDYIDDYLFDGEYVLLGEDGAPFLDPLKNKAYTVNGKFWVNNHVHILKGYISNKYLCFYLNQYNFIGHVTGTTRLKLNQSSMKSINIKVAPLNEQNRIVEKIEELFSDLDKATEDLKKTREQLKIYRQSVLKAAFEGKLTEEWRRNNPYEKNYLEKIHRTIKNFNFMKTGQDVPRRLPHLDFLYLPSLPDNWLWIEAHKVCTSVRDGTHDTPKYIENGIPLITSKNLKNGKIDFNNIQFISKRDHKEIIKRSFVENDDILFGMIGTIGNPVIVTCKKEFSIKNVGLFKKNYDYIIPKYLRYWLESSKLFKILKEKDFIKGTTQKFISLGNLRILPIPLSSLEEQYEIVNEIESRLSVCDKLEETVQYSVEKIEYIRQSILKKAFEGKLVPQWPDLPAPQPGKHWVYVIKCNNDSNYIGFTSNLRQRWEQHLSGEGAEWTKKHKPQYIMYWEEFDSKTDAIIREGKLKTGYGRKWIKKEEEWGRLWRAGESAEKLLERIKQEKEKFEPNNKKRKKR